MSPAAPRLSRKDFESLVERALEEVPAAFRKLMVNVEIAVEDRPGPEAGSLGSDLLGLYVGATRDEHLSPFSGSVPPARILLYQRNLEAECEDLGGLRREIGLTVRHEIAHHLGIDDERLHEIWPEGA